MVIFIVISVQKMSEENKDMKSNIAEITVANKMFVEDEMDPIILSETEQFVETNGFIEELKAAKVIMKRDIKERNKDIDTFIPVHNLTRIESGDHLAWWRPEGYWHHALVEKVYMESQEILVLHYNGPSPNGLVLCKGKVVQELLKISDEKGLLYKINYISSYSVDSILKRAKTRLGEEKYNIFSSNCEHYVRWCKTGSGESCVSVQVQGFNWTTFRIVQKVFTCLSKDILKFGIGRLSAETVYVSTTVEHVPIKTIFGGAITWPTLALLCEYFGIMLILMIELLATSLDARRLYVLWSREAVSKAEFTTKVFRRVSQGLGGAGGAVFGAIFGQAIIPVPFIGGLLGSTLGAVLGHYLGHFEGYAFAYFHRKLSNDPHQ